MVACRPASRTRRPSQMAMTLASGPAGAPRRRGGRPAAEPWPALAMAASPRERPQTVDALARREAVGLDDNRAVRRRAPSRRRRRLEGASSCERATAGHRDAGRPGHIAAERFDALDRGRRRLRAEDGEAGPRSASASPAASGASGPTTTRSAAKRRATATTRRAVDRGDSLAANPGSVAMPSDPGATEDLNHPRGRAASFQASACSRPPRPTIRIRVGRRRHRALRPRPHAGDRRQARSIVWVARARPRRA